MSKEVKETYIRSRQWDVDDSYLVVEVQVDSDVFKRNDKVTVTIEHV